MSNRNDWLDQVMEAISSEDFKKLLIEGALTKRAELEQNEQEKLRVKVKMAGAIDDSPWSRACRRKYKNDADWQLKMTTALSKWEARLRNSGFQPFEKVQVGDKHQVTSSSSCSVNYFRRFPKQL